MSDAAHGRIAESRSDAIVIGDGLIGLSITLELVRQGATVRCVGTARPGMASATAAGLLAASIGRVAEGAQRFYDASLALYPSFVDSLRDVDPSLAMTMGVLQLVDPASAATPAAPSRLVADADLAALEPSLAPGRAAVLHPHDGSVDNEQLLAAVRTAVARSPRAAMLRDDVVELARTGANATSGSNGLGVRTERGGVFAADAVILAAGAWTPAIKGLPRPIAIEPLKGQMLAIGATPLRHAVVGNGVYLVPRRTETLVGSTLERTGFDPSTDQASLDRLGAAAGALVPALAAAPRTRTWAGLRPGTPDMLPILGRDPDLPNLIYACGHSKNGILLAPATARSIAALALGAASPHDLSAFSIERLSA